MLAECRSLCGKTDVLWNFTAVSRDAHGLPVDIQSLLSGIRIREPSAKNLAQDAVAQEQEDSCQSKAEQSKAEASEYGTADRVVHALSIFRSAIAPIRFFTAS